MSNEIIKRDANRRVVGAGIGDDSSQDILALRTDPVTKALLINVNAGSATSATSSETASRDGNHKPVYMAWDDINKVL